MTLFSFVILSFAVWRIASLFAREKGPFNVFVEVRKWIYKRTLYNFLREIFTTINNGIVCIWCNSVWFSMLICPFFSKNIFEWLMYSLAVSAGAILLERIINGDSIK